MGCGVACVASLLGISYRESLNLFNRKHANVPNFYCKEIVNILKNRKLNYRYNKVTKKTEQHIHKIGSIVFIRKSEKYFYGHFLLKTKRGFQLGVVCAVPPFPYDDKHSMEIYKDLTILFKKPGIEGIHLGDVKIFDNSWRVAGDSAYVLVVTGHQGEPKSTLSRMAFDKGTFIFDQEDFVIFSCKVIPTPTNEENRAVLENKLKELGVRIFKDVHVSGHAARYDIRDLINMVHPKHIFPSHGNLEMTAALGSLALEMGYKKEFILSTPEFSCLIQSVIHAFYSCSRFACCKYSRLHCLSKHK